MNNIKTPKQWAETLNEQMMMFLQLGVNKEAPEGSIGCGELIILFERVIHEAIQEALGKER